MKISVNKVKILLAAMVGGILACVGYTVITWQYYVIILPAIIVITKWTDIFYNNHRRKKEIQNNERN